MFGGFKPRENIAGYTAVPNELFDDVMKDVSPVQFVILSIIIRKTYGFVAGSDDKGNPIYKTSDKISQNQFGKLTGLNSRTIKNNIEVLIEKGYIEKVKNFNRKKNIPAEYKVRQKNDPPPESNTGGLLNQIQDPPESNTGGPPESNTGTKETDLKINNLKKERSSSPTPEKNGKSKTLHERFAIYAE